MDRWAVIAPRDHGTVDDPDDPVLAFSQPGGPVLAAIEWMRSITERSDLGSVWDLTDAPLRLSLVQSWMMVTGLDRQPDRDLVAVGVVARRLQTMWTEFEEWRVGRWRDLTFHEIVAKGFGVVSTPEYVGPDIEFVRLAIGSVDEPVDIEGDVMAQTLTMRFADGGWLVAGIGRSLPRPGWPPGEDEIPTDYGVAPTDEP